MPYCLYLRKSRADIEAEAKGEEETLARHEKALLELAKRQRLNIMQIYREVVSGETIAARPVMQQLLTEVEQGIWEGVLVMEVERLARGDTMDQGLVAQTFKYSNTKIITPVKTYDPNNEYDEEYFEFGLFMSRREYKTINRRLQRGRIASVKEGKYLGTKPPYGYIRKKLDNQKGYTLEIAPEQAEIVKMVYELYTQGELQPNGNIKRLGVSLIVRKLNDLRIPPLNSDAWVMSTIQGMLRNPVYIGKIRWNARPSVKKMVDGEMKRERPRVDADDWILVDGLHDAIIDEDTFNLAQEYMSNNQPLPAPKDRQIKNPLAGLVICGVCGRSLVRRPYARNYPDGLMCPVTSCSNVSSQLHLVEKRLLEALEQWLQEYKMNWDIDSEQNPKQNIQIDINRKAVKKLEEEIKNLEKQMDNIHNLLEQGVYTTDKFLERSKVINDKIDAARDDMETLLKDLHWQVTREENQKIFIPKVEKALEIYKETEDLALKNKLLKEVIEKAVYTKTERGIKNAKIDNFELVLWPKLPK
ncbi:MAG TPA: recombinase family protein [Patescibacteria group bacterium]|nr:recombinase family protein [Patescibacteria group bacterium]